MAWKVVGVVLGLWPSDPKPGRLVSRSPDSGLIQHLILQPHLPSPREEGQGEESSASPWKLLRGKITPADVLHRAPHLTPLPPLPGNAVRAAYFGTQGTSNCRLRTQELSPSSLSKQYLLLSGTSGISYGKINADTHQSPGQSSWPCWGARGWERGGSLCAPFSGILLTPGTPGFLAKTCSLSVCIVRGSVRPGPN